MALLCYESWFFLTKECKGYPNNAPTYITINSNLQQVHTSNDNSFLFFFGREPKNFVISRTTCISID
jgi:hypothetical protein